ncbi:uncharacterized protein LOC105283840 isoform X3 [Ooceraea biroi]|uniref:uncharacterized protein LOC105283840 isoform X3 n=1 Tax=Ooceraea biroi TaxID=2015173 RepID=UPI0005BE2DD4|nr:uncharacterized protein LOC105283840 isoform X3 [Ooceraea biroi]
MSSSKSVKQPRKAYPKEQHEMTHSEKLRLIDDELNSFYKYCQQAGFTEEEMDIICQPLVAAMRRSWLQLVFRGTFVLIALGTLACLAAQLDFVGTHFTALSRLLLIRVLPIWNWQPLYYENCMINNPFYNDYTITEEDCMTCEALETIDRLSDVRYRTLVENYLSRDAPAIITDAMDSWAVMNTDYFWFDNITHVGWIYLTDVIDNRENERPCEKTLLGERAFDGDGTMRPDLQPANWLFRPCGVPATRSRARGGQVVRPLAKLRDQRRQSAQEVLSAAVLPLQHGVTGALQLGAHVLGL